MEALLGGFDVALSPENLLYVLFGAVIGMVIGVLPGLGPAPTIALMLPLTYSLSPETAVIMLAGVYYGSMYGGTVTSVLLRIPGEAASVVTAIDGYEMARQGRAGPALGISAIGSFIGGTVAIVGLTVAAPALADVALHFGPPEYAALALLGLVLASYLGSGSFPRAFIAVCIGLLLATVGQDPITGDARFTGGSIELLSGLDLVAVAIGLFGIGEILYNLERTTDVGEAVRTKFRDVFPARDDLRAARGAIARGSVLGFLIGALPGGGGVVSSLGSYAMEKRLAKQPERFGKGAIEGVAGPETANNASSSSAFIPLLTLGIPSNVVLALIFGALLLQGITPGPGLVNEHPDLFWGVIASMYIGNVLLLILSLPLVGVFAQLLRVRMTLLAPIAVMLSVIGAYSINNSVFDIWAVFVFGIVGYLMRKIGFEPGPLVLAFVLGTILETSFRQSLLVSGGSFGIFVSRPFSAAVIIAVAAVVVWSVRQSLRARKKERAQPRKPPAVV
jgi:putative tricarboxylic transport membrane protein